MHETSFKKFDPDADGAFALVHVEALDRRGRREGRGPARWDGSRHEPEPDNDGTRSQQRPAFGSCDASSPPWIHPHILSGRTA